MFCWNGLVDQKDFACKDVVACICGSQDLDMRTLQPYSDMPHLKYLHLIAFAGCHAGNPHPQWACLPLDSSRWVVALELCSHSIMPKVWCCLRPCIGTTTINQGVLQLLGFRCCFQPMHAAIAILVCSRLATMFPCIVRQLPHGGTLRHESARHQVLTWISMLVTPPRSHRLLSGPHPPAWLQGPHPALEPQGRQLLIAGLHRGRILLRLHGSCPWGGRTVTSATEF
jgi:hypothetical protein